MIINREFSMPNKNTFSIKPIKNLIEKYWHKDLYSIDPFANNSKLATVTNDLDDSFNTDYHLDALDFLNIFEKNSIDLVFFDPPYSVRQVSECYKKMNKTVTMETTQSSFWSNIKEEITRILKPNGIVICCGWNSCGMYKKLGFDKIEILMVYHGGPHNDTIVTVDKLVRG